MTSETDLTPFISLGDAAVLAVDACALSFQTYGRARPADADVEDLWPPVFDCPPEYE